MFGELVPIGGGDPIPLLRDKLVVGRRESCDIVLQFANISSNHCELTLNAGYWFVKDLGSRNGVKVNDIKVEEKRLDPGDILSIAKHKYEVQYLPENCGALGPPPADKEVRSDIFGKSLLERAGLQKPGKPLQRDKAKRYDVLDDGAGQIKDRTKPT